MLRKFTLIAILALGALAVSAVLAGPGGSAGYPPPDSNDAPAITTGDALQIPQSGSYRDTPDCFDGPGGSGY